VIRQFAFFASVMSFFLVSRAFPFSQVTHVQIAPGSVKSGTIEVCGVSGKGSVQAREFQVRIELPSQRIATRDVSMLYDPATKLFWWGTEHLASVPKNSSAPVFLPSNSVICLTDSAFVMFWNGWVSTSQIFVRESSERYPSLDAGQAYVLRVLEDRRGDIDAERFIHEYKRILFNDLGRDFLDGKFSAISVGPTLSDVRRVGDDWQITEDGHYGGTALIILNDKYEVIKTTLLPTK
jgi:hypothetical protein